jgi:hypothetical protein
MQDPTPIDPNTQITITLNAAQWNVVLEALGNMPFRASAPLIQEISNQAQQSRFRKDFNPPLQSNSHDSGNGLSASE